MLLWCLLIAFSGCGSIANPIMKGPPDQGSLSVTFAPSLSYEQALRLVTDLGLQPAMDCLIAGRLVTPESALPVPRWQPMGQRDTFMHEHRLLVDMASPPLDWLKRLQTTPGVQETRYAGDLVCLAVIYGTPPPGVAVPLNAAQAGTYARVTFTHPLDNYDAALYVVSNVGLRLVDPCYEQALLQRQETPPWHPMGQEHTFATTHALVVATSKRVTSSLWQEQLRAFPGVVTIESPFSVKC